MKAASSQLDPRQKKLLMSSAIKVLESKGIAPQATMTNSRITSPVYSSALLDSVMRDDRIGDRRNHNRLRVTINAVKLASLSRFFGQDRTYYSSRPSHNDKKHGKHRGGIKSGTQSKIQSQTTTTTIKSTTNTMNDDDKGVGKPLKMSRSAKRGRQRRLNARFKKDGKSNGNNINVKNKNKGVKKDKKPKNNQQHPTIIGITATSSAMEIIPPDPANTTTNTKLKDDDLVQLDPPAPPQSFPQQQSAQFCINSQQQMAVDQQQRQPLQQQESSSQFSIHSQQLEIEAGTDMEELATSTTTTTTTKPSKSPTMVTKRRSFQRNLDDVQITNHLNNNNNQSPQHIEHINKKQRH